MKAIATWIRECDESPFQRVFHEYPDVRCWNARIEIMPENIAGLLLTGGSDISSEYLRQPVSDPALIHDADPARDAWEFAALEKTLKARKPFLAICRGLQVLNVALGGTLHLDIPRHGGFKHDNVQALRYEPGATLRFPKVNSSHHQALDRLGTGLEVEARCFDDEVIEQVHLRDYPFGLGVQYHPERDPLYRPLFDSFVAQVRKEPS